MTKTSKRSSKPSNFFGGLGYISVIGQWLWTIALVLPTLLENESFKQFILPDQSTTVQSPVTPFDENSIFMIVVAAAVTVVVLLVTIVVLIRLPIALVRTSQKTVTSAADAIVPTITHHKPLSKKKRAVLTARIRLYIKFALSVIPLLPLLFVTSSSIGLDSSIALLIGAILAIGSLVWFSIQYGSAKLLKQPFENLI